MLSEFHVTWLVTSCEEPSLYTPSAESCLLCPEAIENTAGVIVIDDSEGAVTTTFPVPEIDPNVAVTVTDPALKAVRKPAPLTEATVWSDVLQITWAVRDCVLASEYTPVAVNCSVPPDANDGEGVPTLMLVSTGDVTVTLAFAVTEPIVAVIDTVPALSAVSIPVLLTVAIEVSLLFQVTWPVIDCVLLSV